MATRLLANPPCVVYQSRRNDSDQLDSTTRMVLDVQLSSDCRHSMDLLFVLACKRDPSKKRDVVLQDVLKEVIWVDVLQYDFSLVTYYSGAVITNSPDDPAEDELPAADSPASPAGDSDTGGMSVAPPPSVEFTASKSTPGLLHLSILPRTLPISSTHSGRPFRLVIRIRCPGGIPSRPGGPPTKPVDDVLVTTPFHVLAKEPSKQSTMGARPRGQAAKKRKRGLRAGDGDGGSSGPGGINLSAREIQLLSAAEAAVRCSLKAEMASGSATAAASSSSSSLEPGPTVTSLLFGDLNRLVTARLMAEGLLPELMGTTGLVLVDVSGSGSAFSQAGSLSIHPGPTLAMPLPGVGLGAADDLVTPSVTQGAAVVAAWGAKSKKSSNTELATSRSSDGGLPSAKARRLDGEGQASASAASAGPSRTQSYQGQSTEGATGSSASASTVSGSDAASTVRHGSEEERDDDLSVTSGGALSASSKAGHEGVVAKPVAVPAKAEPGLGMQVGIGRGRARPPSTSPGTFSPVLDGTVLGMRLGVDGQRGLPGPMLGMPDEGSLAGAIVGPNSVVGHAARGSPAATFPMSAVPSYGLMAPPGQPHLAMAGGHHALLFPGSHLALPMLPGLPNGHMGPNMALGWAGDDLHYHDGLQFRGRTGLQSARVTPGLGADLESAEPAMSSESEIVGARFR